MAKAVTREELREELETFATKEDLERFATKQELRDEHARFATTQELRDELARFATKQELRDELARFATKDDLQGWADALYRALSTNLQTEIARFAMAIEESTRKMFVALDDKYKDLPGRVAALEDRQREP